MTRCCVSPDASRSRTVERTSKGVRRPTRPTQGLASTTRATNCPWIGWRPGRRCGAPKRSTPPSPDPRCPKDDEAHPKALRLGKVSFPEAKAQTISVEVAETDHDRQRGLMFRTKMADDHGMIFTFADKDNHTFWMHNTCIPLDMLYIDDDGMIVGIEENTPTMSDDTFEVGCDSKYVLEVNAGWTRAHGVMAGQKAKLEGI